MFGILTMVAVVERLKAVFTVLVLNTYLQDVDIFCDYSGIWNQLHNRLHELQLPPRPLTALV